MHYLKAIKKKLPSEQEIGTRFIVNFVKKHKWQASCSTK